MNHLSFLSLLKHSAVAIVLGLGRLLLVSSCPPHNTGAFLSLTYHHQHRQRQRQRHRHQHQHRHQLYLYHCTQKNGIYRRFHTAISPVQRPEKKWGAILQDDDNDNDAVVLCRRRRQLRLLQAKRSDDFYGGEKERRKAPLAVKTEEEEEEEIIFTTPSTSTNTRPGSLMEATIREGKVPYGETSRKYRRTTFTYDDWVAHRNEDKQITTNIRGMFFSGIIRQLQEEIGLVTFIALVVVLWNNLLVILVSGERASGMFMSMSMPMVGLDILPRLALPALPFTLSSPALGLLLVFKTNASYARWLEARNTWSKIVSQARNIVRMSCTFTANSGAYEHDNNNGNNNSGISGVTTMEDLSDSIWLLCRCLMNDLSDPSDEGEFEKEVRDTFVPFSQPSTPTSLSDQQRQYLVSSIIQSTDRTMAALAHTSRMLDNIPIDEKRRVEIDKSLVIMGDCISVCEKIYSSPVPLVYTRHTGRFLSLWMLLLPTALYDSFAAAGNNVGTSTAVDAISYIAPLFNNLQCLAVIPTTAIIGLFLFGIDELAIQLEEPFSILPMQKFCDDVRKSAKTVNEWSLPESSFPSPPPQ